MHLVQQVCVKLVPVLSQADDSPSKGLNVDQVNGADVLTHGGLGSFQNLLGLVLICRDLCHLCQLHTQEVKSKVKFMLFSNHDGSLLRWQPGALHTQATGLSECADCVHKQPSLCQTTSWCWSAVTTVNQKGKDRAYTCIAAVVELQVLTPGAGCCGADATKNV